jgi:hypothetical protein
MAGHGWCVGWSDPCHWTYADAKAIFYPVLGIVDASFITGSLDAE